MFQNIKYHFINKKHSVLASLLCFLLFPFFSFAQTGAGKLTGKVTDGSTNEPLAGVSISSKGKTGTASITDGTYILSLPAGTYSITYSYLGYQKKEITGIVIKAGQTTFLDIILQKSTAQMQGVVITSTIKRESQSAVYSVQKEALPLRMVFHWSLSGKHLITMPGKF